MIISLHYPKTAGTSFRQTLKDVYSNNLYIHHTHESLKDKDYYTGNNIKIVHGHLKISDYKEMFPDANVIVWLRDPAARVLSYYNYCKYVREAPFSKNFGIRYPDFINFINSKRMDMLENEFNTYVDGYSYKDFYFIGITEKYPFDLHRLSKLLGWNRFKTHHINKSKNNENVNITDNMRQIIYKKLHKEYELYKITLINNG